MSSGTMGRRSGDSTQSRQRRVVANTTYAALLALCISRIPTVDCSLVSVPSLDFLRRQDVSDQYKKRDRSDLPSVDGYVLQEEYAEKDGGCSSPYDQTHPHGPEVSFSPGIYREPSEENSRNHQQQQFEAYNSVAEPTTLAQLGRTSRDPPFATSISKYQHSDAAQGTATLASTLTHKLSGATVFVALLLALLVPLARALSSHWPYFLAGAICASASHTAAVPLDVLKTRIQCSSPGEYKGTWDAFVRILRSEGARVLFCGAGATVVGYAMQGFLKFGFFEFLKPLFSGLFGGVAAGGNASPVLGSLIAASVAAEIVGSSALTPLEAARIRMVAEPNYAKGLRSGLERMFSEEGMSVLTRGLPAVLAKQLPYTVTKLVTFDVLTRAAASKAVRPGRRVWITAACAVAAGMLSSLASQPGDSLLSTLNSERRGAGVEMSQQGSTSPQEPVAVALYRIARSAGLSGLFRGTAARMMHVTTVVTVQLVIYQSVKNLVGIST